MASGDPYIQAANAAQAYKAAAMGGAGDPNTAGNHPLLNVLLPALGALRKQGLFGAADAGLSAYNTQRYNQYVAEQTAKTQENNAGLVNNATGLNISGGFDPKLAESIVPYIRTDNATPSINATLQGQPLNLAPNASYDPKLVQDYLARQGAVTDNNAAQTQVPQAFGAGQSASDAQQYMKPQAPWGASGPTPIPGATNPVAQGVMQQPAGLDNGQGGLRSLSPQPTPTLQGNANISSVPPPSVSPYMQPGVNPTVIQGAFNNGAQNNVSAVNNGAINYRGQQTINNTKAYQAGLLKIGQQNADSNTMRANRPPAGAAPSFDQTLYNSLSPAEQEQYRQNFANGGTGGASFALNNLNGQEKDLTGWAVRNGVIDKKTGVADTASPNYGAFVSRMSAINTQRQGLYGSVPGLSSARTQPQSAMQAANSGLIRSAAAWQASRR